MMLEVALYITVDVEYLYEKENVWDVFVSKIPQVSFFKPDLIVDFFSEQTL